MQANNKSEWITSPSRELTRKLMQVTIYVYRFQNFNKIQFFNILDMGLDLRLELLDLGLDLSLRLWDLT